MALRVRCCVKATTCTGGARLGKQGADCCRTHVLGVVLCVKHYQPFAPTDGCRCRAATARCEAQYCLPLVESPGLRLYATSECFERVVFECAFEQILSR